MPATGWVPEQTHQPCDRQLAEPQPQSGPQPDESPVPQLQLLVSATVPVASLLAVGPQPHEQVLFDCSTVTSGVVSVVVKVFSPPP